MKEILDIVLVFFVSTLLLVPFFIALGMLFPKRTSKTANLINQMPGRSFGVGLVNLVFFLAVGIVFFILAEQASDLLRIILAIPALTIFTVLAITLSFGLTGLVQLIGSRIAFTQSGWRRTLWGALVLGFGCSAPLVGWLLLLPYAVCAGIGAFITSFFQQPADPPPAPSA